MSASGCSRPAGDWRIARSQLHRLWESFTPVSAELLRPELPESAPTDIIGAGLGIAFALRRQPYGSAGRAYPVLGSLRAK